MGYRLFVTLVSMRLSYLQTHSRCVRMWMCRGGAGRWLFPVRYEGPFCPFVDKKMIDGLCSFLCNNTSQSLRTNTEKANIVHDERQ